ncbi:MAG: histone deacetylase [Planctomycetota bacterium]|nr:histone deacetylase [Planctomycetota bacterium]MEC9046517.1 histone deacetylase [Planctomycetota bacterium]
MTGAEVLHSRRRPNVNIYYSDPFTFPLPPKHSFPSEKYRMLRARVERWPASTGVELLLAPRASEDELRLVHNADYLARFATGRLGDVEMKRIGFPWSPELVERSLRSCGGTVAAARHAAQAGRAAYLAGGTHHARADRGAGYCVYNDCAVGARVLQREAGVARLLIVDTDVHQGDGTAAIFAGDPDVFTLSVHGDQNFPAEKARSDLDVALPTGTGDEAYLDALRAAFAAAVERARPQFVFYLSGADAFVGDRFGRLSLSKAGLRQRDELVLGELRRRGLPHVTVMGGGYGKEIADSVDVYEATVAETAR